MRRILVGTVIVGCLLYAGAVTGQSALSAPREMERFLGLWEGVDPLDGSPVRLSLSDIDNDGVLEHTLQEDFYTTCFELGPDHSRGRGVVNGTAIASSPVVLSVLSDLTCLADNNTRTSFGMALNEYRLASRGRVIVLPTFGTAPAVVLHRVAP